MTKAARKPKSPNDYGTPELQAKRLALVLNRDTGELGDPAMSFNQLGRLCEQGLLDTDHRTARRMFDAGMTVLLIWQACFPTQVTSTLAQFMPKGGGDFDPEDAHRDRKALTAFFGPSRSNYLSAVLDCVFHGKHQEPGKLKKLRKGLKLVIEWQKQK